MTTPDDIADALVSLLEMIPFVAENFTGGVTAYHDMAFTRSQYALAVQKAPSASILVVWMGTTLGRRQDVDVWRHQFSTFIRPPEGMDGSTVFSWIINGIPTGQNLRLISLEVHPNCEQMDVPTCSRKTDADGLDYFELVLAFPEKGDYF